MTYTAIKLIKRPEIEITPDLFEVVQLQTPELKDGEILIKQTHMSLDPAMKGWMMPDRDSYIPPVELGDVMRSSGVGEIVESKNDKFPVGARVQGMTGWAEYIVSDGERMNLLPEAVPTEAVLCVLALPGMTAYQGLINVGKPKAGETLVVSGAAGSVGSMVGQIAKAEGLRVVGTAGTDDKCKWLTEELGFDAAINYKSARLEGITILKKRLIVQGFTMPDHFDKIPSMMQEMSKYLMQGKIKYRAHTLHGLESAIEGINLLFTGGNTGKLLIEL